MKAGVGELARTRKLSSAYNEPEWRNGIRTGLKILGRKACGFESRLRYHA